MGSVVIGTVEGDLHDIGKNLVGMLLSGAGFEVVNQCLSMLLVGSTAAMTLWLWTDGVVGVGAVVRQTEGAAVVAGPMPYAKVTVTLDGALRPG